MDGLGHLQARSLAIQIGGLHDDDMVLVAAVGIDTDGAKHPMGLIWGATESAVTVQALLDNPIGRGLDPAVCHLFIVDGAKALDADKAKRLIENLTRRLEREAPDLTASILKGLDELLTMTCLGLSMEPRRALACTNIVENMNGTIRRVCHHVKRWRDTSMALRWIAAGMMEAAKGFRRLKASKLLSALRAVLGAHQAKYFTLEEETKAA